MESSCSVGPFEQLLCPTVSKVYLNSLTVRCFQQLHHSMFLSALFNGIYPRCRVSLMSLNKAKRNGGCYSFL